MDSPMGKKSKKRERAAAAASRRGGEEKSANALALAASASGEDHRQHPPKKKKRSRHRDMTGNPLFRKQSAFFCTLDESERDNFFSDASVSPERRAELWMKQAELGESLVNRYSWATPNERALRILRHFSPLVEIGCGSNAYWCQQMQQFGIDVVGYDHRPSDGGRIGASSQKQSSSFVVRKGGPEALASLEIRESKRNLFLCYPDESDDHPFPPLDDEDPEEPPRSMGAQCLDYFQGQYVIHVGELYGDTASHEQAPWGRSSSPEFQQRLASEFHCLLRAEVPNWLHVHDTISVWKRSETCSIVFAADEEEDDDEDEEVQYRHVPVEERLPSDLAAPCLAHLLRQEGDKEETHKKKTSQKTGASGPHPAAGSEDAGEDESRESRNKKKRPAPIRTRPKTDPEIFTYDDVSDGSDADFFQAIGKNTTGYKTPW